MDHYGKEKKVCLKVNDCFMVYDKGRNLCAKTTGDQRESHPIMTPETARRLHFLCLSQQGKNLSSKWKKVEQAPTIKSSSTL